MFDVISFDKLRARILEHGIHDMKMSTDKTEVTFILKNGEVYSLYTTEEETQYAVCNDWNFMQSELVVSQTVEP